jgi:hypothetical protein
MRSNKSMFRRALVAGVMFASVAVLTACDTERILEATDPDLINPENLNSPDGAEGVRIGAVQRQRQRKHLAVRWATGGRVGNRVDLRPERSGRYAARGR